MWAYATMLFANETALKFEKIAIPDLTMALDGLQTLLVEFWLL